MTQHLLALKGYVKGHNATLHTGFESKANGRFTVTVWTHSIQTATTSTGG